MAGADAPHDRDRIEREFKEHLSDLTNDTIKAYYTAQYKAALLGLIQSGKTPDELQDEVTNWLHYEVDNFSKPIRSVSVSPFPLNCIYGIDTIPCDECAFGDRNNSQHPCSGCHHGKACLFKQKEADQ